MIFRSFQKKTEMDSIQRDLGEVTHYGSREKVEIQIKDP